MFRPLITLAALLSISAAAHAERFTNAVLGLTIEKPADWHVLTAEANADNLARAEIGTPEFQEAIRRHATVPLFAFTRYPEPHPDMNASVKVNTRPVGNLEGKSGQEILEILLPVLRGAMADVEVVTAPEKVVLAGRAAGHLALKYTLKSAGASYPAASEMWVVPNGNYLIIVGAGYRPDDKFGDRQAVLRIVNSLALRN